jgi:hypothetical protein
MTLTSRVRNIGGAICVLLGVILLSLLVYNAIRHTTSLSSSPSPLSADSLVVDEFATSLHTTTVYEAGTTLLVDTGVAMDMNNGVYIVNSEGKAEKVAVASPGETFEITRGTFAGTRHTCRHEYVDRMSMSVVVGDEHVKAGGVCDVPVTTSCLVVNVSSNTKEITMTRVLVDTLTVVNESLSCDVRIMGTVIQPKSIAMVTHLLSETLTPVATVISKKVQETINKNKTCS